MFIIDDPVNLSYMQRALALARRAAGRTSPNPLVGAVIVRNGRIVGEGYHRRAGAPHAEIEALQQAGQAARGATIYVTLEPCAHQGRTPPCTDALVAAGVSEVFYATDDLNPLVHGRGKTQLLAAGIAVHEGPCQAEAYELNRPFFKHVITALPYVTAKFAMSLDGKIATRTGDSRWITNDSSRRYAHEMRNVTDCILVGAGTVIADDPRLTTRLSTTSEIFDDKLPAEIHHPLRIVVDSRGRIPLTAKIFDPMLPGQTVLATTAAIQPAYCSALSGQGVDIWKLPAAENGKVSLPALLAEIGRRGMLTLLVEGGSELLGAFFTQRLVDRVCAFIAPMIIGGVQAPGPVGGTGIALLAEAIRLSLVRVERLDDNLCLEALINSDVTSFIRKE